MLPLGVITIIIQVLLVVHIVRTGRDRWWIYIVVFLPVIGGIAYFVVEVLPNLFHARQTDHVVKNIKKLINPEKEIKELEAQLAFSDTFSHRKALADCYFENKLYEEAIQAYQHCLEGTHKDDIYILDSLARTLFYKNDFAQAQDAILHLISLSKKPIAPQTHLLLALTYEQLHNFSEAEAVYSNLAKSFPGEEARYRYAQFLNRMGKKEQAQKVLHEILTLAQHSPGFYVREQRQWINLARKELAAK